MNDKHKLNYLYAFEAAFRKLCPTGFNDGMWINAHMHHGNGKLSAEDAALRFWNQVKP